MFFFSCFFFHFHFLAPEIMQILDVFSRFNISNYVVFGIKSQQGIEKAINK